MILLEYELHVYQLVASSMAFKEIHILTKAMENCIFAFDLHNDV